MIADLHCDLLCYLQKDNSRSAYDPQVRCALPQLIQGGVFLQTMAVFTETYSGSSVNGFEQARIFARLPKMYPDGFKIVKQVGEYSQRKARGPIGILLAVENASSLFEENEPLDNGFERFDKVRKLFGRVSYLSLTWNMENRFGGGALTQKGLKTDGMRLLDYLQEKRVPLDLSHASDPLAYDIFNYLEKKSYDLPVLASHSNFRSAYHKPRNLPDEIAKEIIARKGVIGLNFVRLFLGDHAQKCLDDQLEHALRLGGRKSICFGADFFYPEDLSLENRKPHETLFFPELADASAYGKVIGCWQKKERVFPGLIEDVACRNLLEFLARVL